MSPRLTKIKHSAGVQAVLVFDLGRDPAIVAKNYKHLGIVLTIFQAHGVASGEFIKFAGPAAEGVRLSAAATLLVADRLPADNSQQAVVTAYIQACKERYKQDASTFGSHDYGGLTIAVDAIKRAGSVDKAKVRDAIKATKGYIGTSDMVRPI